MIRTAILGASGYVGGELLRLLAAHPELRPAKMFGGSKAGQPLGAVHPQLAAAYSDAIIETFEGHLDGIDLRGIFWCDVSHEVPARRICRAGRA